MQIKRTIGEQVFNIFNMCFMIVLMIAMVYPLLHVTFASLSSGTLLAAHRGLLLKPLGFTLESYRAVLKFPMILKGYTNTVFIVVAGVSINIIMTSLGAYFLSCKDVLFKKVVMMMIVFTMFFGGGLIPFYFTVRDLGLYNTHWALIIPSSISTFNMIIMRTSFMAIPDSLEESAKLDGANHFVILFRIILPLSKAVIAVVTLYYAVGHWNSWFNAMVFLQDRSLYPLQLVLREILISNDTNMLVKDFAQADRDAVGETIKYTVILVATLPILCVYPFLQKYFVKGAMIGALKG